MLRVGRLKEGKLEFSEKHPLVIPDHHHIAYLLIQHYHVATRYTKRRHSNSKRWAVIFVCMSIQGVHIEVIESMDTSSFINALRRFIAIRGPVKLIRSDRESNFVGAVKELQIPSNLDVLRV